MSYYHHNGEKTVEEDPGIGRLRSAGRVQMGIVCARIVLVFDISVVFLWDFHW